MVNLTKKIAKSFATIFLSAGLGLTTCAGNPVSSSVEHSIPKRDHAAACSPHYLEDVKRPADPLENMLEKYRVYKSMGAKYPYETYKPPINGSIEVERKIHGVNTTLIFPNYVKQKDGRVRHYHAMGVDTYSAKEFECVVKDNVEYIERGARLAMDDYEGMLALILQAQEKELKEKGVLKKDDKLKDLLDKDVPGYEGLKVKNVLFTPDIVLQDFIPTRYYFDDLFDHVLGVSYLDSGIIAINPKARVLDHIIGWPAILVHEMTHRNQKLQHSPLTFKVDAELWASLPMLAHEDIMHFLYHSYFEDIRKVAKICFNFDSELAEADLTYLHTMMGIEFEKKNNYQKLRDYIKKVDTISKAVREVGFKYIQEFYTSPLYFMTLNEFLKDDNATFKLMMYMNYHPALLGGPEKTKDFIQENEELFEKLAREVIWDLKGKRNNLDDDGLLKIKKILEERLAQMNPAKRNMLIPAARKFGIPFTKDLNKEVIEFGLRLYRLGIVDFDQENEEVQLK